MKIIHIDSDGNIKEPNFKEKFVLFTNRIGYAILALFLLSYFFYAVSPFIWKDITLFQALLFGCLVSVLKEYVYSNTGLTFLITSVGYMIIPIGAYYLIH